MPLFFFTEVADFPPLASSEYRLDLERLDSESDGVVLMERSPMEKLEEWRTVGLIMLALGAVCESGGGPGRRNEFW